MLKLTVFGVGDGDCILIELPDGRFGLVDCCTRGEDRTSPALAALRGKRLAFCCLTHPHEDHFRGMLEILKSSELATDKFWFALSDLENVVGNLNFAPRKEGEPAVAAHRRESETGGFLDLIEWVWGQPNAFAEQILDVQFRRFGDVELVLFGPDAVHFNRYKKALRLQRELGRPISRTHANSISLVVLIRYFGRMVWLLGDLTTAALKTLEAREANRSPVGASRGVKAAVLKVPHHGAKNAWFSTMAESFTRCQPDDVILVSAGGGPHRPHPQVWNYWLGTGKRLRGTWQPRSTPSRDRRLGGWAADDIDLLAKRVPAALPRDLEIHIPSEGPIEIKEIVVPSIPPAAPAQG